MNQTIIKKDLAFLIAVTPNIAFAGANVALSINRHMQNQNYDIVIYYSYLPDSDINAFRKIPNVKLVNFNLPDRFVSHMLPLIPKESRFKTINHLMCFAHFEIFSLLEQYHKAVWFDADILIQKNISELPNFVPFAISTDIPWNVQINFDKPVPGYNMNLPGYCSAVMVADDTLPYKNLHQWCYKKSEEYASYLINLDQGIINLMFQEFKITPFVLEQKNWQCSHTWEKYAVDATIVHFGHNKKVWNDLYTFMSYPQWHKQHLQWLDFGGSDFEKHRKFIKKNLLPKFLIFLKNKIKKLIKKNNLP